LLQPGSSCSISIQKVCSCAKQTKRQPS